MKNLIFRHRSGKMEDPLTSLNRGCQSLAVQHISLEQMQILWGSVQLLQMGILWIT